MTEPAGNRAAALIVASNQEGQVLLVRSARRQDRWELPGGMVEPGETAMEAARRELREEAGLEATSMDLVGTYFGSRDGLLRTVFAGTILAPHTGQAGRGEILDIAWFGPLNLPHPMPALAVRMIEDSRRGVRGVSATVLDDSELV